MRVLVALVLALIVAPTVGAAVTSRIWSPIATPTRGISPLPARRKTPNGRFWIGKSVPGACADSTHETRVGSVVSFTWGGVVGRRGVAPAGAAI